jgi:hypothetical protein
MLKTVDYSRATKTRGIAVTYRAGTGEKYATCPASCKMNCSGKGAKQIDADYLDALLDAVPRRGVSLLTRILTGSFGPISLRPARPL